jgi:hypothetical protein
VGVGVGVGVGDEGGDEEIDELPPHALIIDETRRRAAKRIGKRRECDVKLIRAAYCRAGSDTYVFANQRTSARWFDAWRSTAA